MIAMTQRMARLVNRAEDVAKTFPDIDAEREISPALLDMLWESGFLTLMVPKEYDGQGASFMESVRVIETLSQASAPAGMLVLLQCMGVLPLTCSADSSQKERWLKAVVHERKFMAFALSEPEDFTGKKSDETKASRDGSGYRIDGRKVFVSRGAEADIVVVFAVTDQSAGLENGLSAFVVERGTKGFFIAGEADRPGLEAVPWSELKFESCLVGEDKRIGEEGTGYGTAAKSLVQAGPLLAAVSLGLIQRTINFCVEMTRMRGMEWTSLSEFQPVEILLADMSIALETSRAITYRGAMAFDEGAAEHFSLSRHAKISATENAVSVLTKAIGIFGNQGVLREFPLRAALDEALVLKGMLGANTVQCAAIVRHLLKMDQT